MKIIHWNVSKKSHPVTGAKRYEDELFENIKTLREDIEIERIQRADNRYIGSTFVSWFLRYRCKNADIVHATFQTIAPALSFKKRTCVKKNNLKFIVTVHDLNPLLYPSNIRDISTKLQWIFTPKALKKANRIIAISEFTKKEIIKIAGIREDKIDVVYQGIDHLKYYPMDKEKCKERFSLNIDDKYILVVASNEENKRMDLTKKVFDEIRKQRKDIKMLKVGYGETLEGEEIINPGWVPESEMPALFNAADVYLHTSEYEGFGLPVLEAMACGVPVVVTNKASIPEVVGNAGEMVNLDSEDCVEQFVEKILENIDKGKDEKAIKQSKKFSWERTAKETIKVYDTMMRKGGS